MSDEPSTLLNELKVMFPWLDQIGLTPQFFQELSATSASADEMVVKLRQQPQYKARFAGMWRSDGSLRMNEAQYLAREQDYRTVLRQFGYDGQYTTPASLVGIFDSEQDPNELRDRMTMYQTVKESSAATKDAFYVYAGMNVTDDDLFDAMVDPAASQKLSEAYNARVAAQTFDYTTWITRATERGLQRVTETLTQLQKSGALTGQAVQSILRADPGFARSIMDAIYTNAGATGSAQMSLQDLMSSFEFASIGAAARNAGLEMPTKERLGMIRAAGIDRAKASAGYTQYGQQAGKIDDAVRRATGQRFGTEDFEDAQFFGDAAAAGALNAGLAGEEAAGKATGQFRFEASRQGRLVQQGFRTS